VRGVHHVHAWQVGEKPVLTLHVHAIPPHDHDALLQKIHRWLHEHYNIEHATVQIEYQRCDGTECELGMSNTDAHAHHHH
jgi:cobalt-zinc-cadmium efflux system protein